MKITLPSFYTNLTPDYLKTRRKELDSLTTQFDQYAKDKNAQELIRKFHKLAGSGGSFGLQEISNLAFQVENHLKEEKGGDALTAFQKYCDYVNSVELNFEEA